MLLAIIMVMACIPALAYEEWQDYSETSPEYFQVKYFGNGTCSIKGYTGRERNVVIPEYINQCRVIGIEPRAFNNNLILTSITLPDSMEIICDSAFLKCTSLREVHLSKNLWKIGEYAFQNCTSLERVVIPENVIFLYRGIFYGCHSLEEVTIQGDVISIDDYAFNGNINMRSINLPSSITKIGNLSFTGCTNLTFRVERNSYAYNWCRQFNLPYTIY